MTAGAATPRRWRRWVTPALTTLVVLLLSTVSVALPRDREVVVAGSPRTGTEASASETGAVAAADAVPAEGADVSAAAPGPGVATSKPASSGTAAAPRAQAAAAVAATPAGVACAPGRNGGATDVGVTADKIRLASTVVLSGTGASFLADSPKGMQAAIQRVNREGGICGRRLELTVRDDGWDANRGLTFIRNFIQDGYFALPVVPSSEGLTAAIEAGDIKRSGIPVAGSDGMLRQQYTDPWVWPVATATESTMRIMAKHAYDQGARTFGIVYDNKYRFGLEGADAFKKYVSSLPGATVAASSPIEPGQSSYGPEVKKFNDGCNPCDMVALLLEPATATTWIAGRPSRGKIITSGAQTLFNLRFAKDCGSACQGYLVWTGYTPPIDALASLPGVAQFVDDVRAIDPGIDVNNAFLQGAYLGTSAFIEALRQVGPNLTRARLQAVLDSMTYQTDLAGPLSWTPQRRNANHAAQAFSLQYASDSFSGFRNEQTGRISDPNIGG